LCEFYGLLKRKTMTKQGKEVLMKKIYCKKRMLVQNYYHRA